MPRCINFCDTRGKQFWLPQVLTAFSEDLRTSIGQREALEWFHARGAVDAAGIYAALRRHTVYRDDPQCWDCSSTLADALGRQLREGVFGDCGVYAVAVSALIFSRTGQTGHWLLLGDADDPARHIVNELSGMSGQPLGALLDATEPDGFPWLAPTRFTVRTWLDPLTGTVIRRA